MTQRSRMSGTTRDKKRVSLLVRDGNLCHWCKEPFAMKPPGRRPSIEHLKKFSEGGPDALSNLVLAHEECNR